MLHSFIFAASKREAQPLIWRLDRWTETKEVEASRMMEDRWKQEGEREKTTETSNIQSSRMLRIASFTSHTSPSHPFSGRGGSRGKEGKEEGDGVTALSHFHLEEGMLL